MRYLLLLGVVISICLPDVIQAEGVRARYLENSGNRTVLELTVEDPPPSSVIVQQQIPPGMQIKSVSPDYMKFSAGKGQVKWLFRRPAAGIKLISLQYARSLSGNRATAVIRCKSPESGKLMTITVP